MKTIRWKKEIYIDVGNGFYAIVELYTTLDGLVAKSYIYKGLMEDEAILMSSVLSPNYDEMYLLSYITEALSNKERCEKLWKVNMMRKRKDTD